MKLYATKDAYVTSTTPSATTNFFADADSGFSTPFDLRNCTLYQYFSIGLVKQDSTGSTVGYDTLKSIYTELNDAYKSANREDGFEMELREFDTMDDMESYVKKFRNRNEALCFGMAWDQFDVAGNTFAIDLRWPYGTLLSPRLPQTHYEESLQNQVYIEQYAKTGFLQAMTTVASKIISQVYGVDDFKFQLMYMPMDSKSFYNDNFAEVVGSLIPFMIYATMSVTKTTIGMAETAKESVI